MSQRPILTQRSALFSPSLSRMRKAAGQSRGCESVERPAQVMICALDRDRKALNLANQKYLKMGYQNIMNKLIETMSYLYQQKYRIHQNG